MLGLIGYLGHVPAGQEEGEVRDNRRHILFNGDQLRPCFPARISKYIQTWTGGLRDRNPTDNLQHKVVQDEIYGQRPMGQHYRAKMGRETAAELGLENLEYTGHCLGIHLRQKLPTREQQHWTSRDSVKESSALKYTDDMRDRQRKMVKFLTAPT